MTFAFKFLLARFRRVINSFRNTVIRKAKLSLPELAKGKKIIHAKVGKTHNFSRFFFVAFPPLTNCADIRILFFHICLQGVFFFWLEKIIVFTRNERWQWKYIKKDLTRKTAPSSGITIKKIIIFILFSLRWKGILCKKNG